MGKFLVKNYFHINVILFAWLLSSKLKVITSSMDLKVILLHLSQAISSTLSILTIYSIVVFIIKCLFDFEEWRTQVALFNINKKNSNNVVDLKKCR